MKQIMCEIIMILIAIILAIFVGARVLTGNDIFPLWLFILLCVVDGVVVFIGNHFLEEEY